MPDFEKLSPEARKRVNSLGLVDGDGDRSVPMWEVRKTYHWQQTFPAHKVLWIRHEYSPGFGFEGMQVGVFDPEGLAKLLAEDKRLEVAAPPSEEDKRLLNDVCVPASMRKTIFKGGSTAWQADPNGSGYGEASWVDYILTTANSWKTPIKKFDLVIEPGPTRDGYAHSDDWNYASFCWDGPVTRVDGHRYEATATNFVPKRELKVLFLTMPVVNAAGGGSAAVVSRPVNRRWVWMGLVAVLLIIGGWLGWRRVRAG
jgi:hypothetical protein